MNRSRAEEERLLAQYIEQLWQTVCRYCTERQDDLTAAGCLMEVCDDSGWHPEVFGSVREDAFPLCRGSFVPHQLPESECCFRIAEELRRWMRNAGFEGICVDVLSCGTAADRKPLDATQEIWPIGHKNAPGYCVSFSAVW